MRPARVVAPTTVKGLSERRRRARAGAAADHHVDGEVLHGRVEDLLDRVVEPVDLIDEEDVALIDVGEDGREVSWPLDGGAAGGVDVHAQLARDDVGQRGLAQAGRTVEQDVVRRFLAHVGRGQQDGQVVLDLRLADVLVELTRSQRRLDRVLVERLYLRREQSGVVIHRRRV